MKNKVKNIASFGIIVMLLSTASCSKDWLKPDPLSFYAPENTFTDAAGMRAALAACSKNMRYEWYGDAPPFITELIFSDVAVEGTTDKSGPAQDLNVQITPTAELNHVDYNRIGWYWIEQYKGIKYANTIITRIDEPTYESEEERNAILGSAYFQRAYRYYRLVHQFGDVPLVLKEYSSPRLDFYTTKREVILQKMKEDLEFAQQWVPDNVHKGEVPKGAISHLLTKVNLALGLFDDAITSANQVIDGGTYTLMTERFGSTAGDASKNIIWDLHQPANKSIPANKEALFLVIDRQIDGGIENGSKIMRNTVPLWDANINTPNGNRGTSNSSSIEIPQVLDYGRGIGRCRPSNYSQWDIWGDENDLRHAEGNWMNMEDLVYNAPALKGSDPYYGKPLQMYNDQGKLIVSDTIRSWFGWPQYKLHVPDMENNPPQGGHTDWYVFRLAETYLLRAEAHFWNGNLAAAAADINAVRQRAKAAPITAADVDMGMILDERARELYFEEPRKTELTRISYIFAMTGKTADNGKSYNLASFSDNNYFYDRVIDKNNFYKNGVVTNHGDQYTISAYHVLWPVPQDAIRANVEGHINQNKGYSGYESNIPPLEQIVDTE